MLALPGLTFFRGDAELGIEILKDYASMIKNGLLPNTLGETQGFTSYNSIDAGLLYCWAVNKITAGGYGLHANEQKILSDVILPAVSQIVFAFLENRVPDAVLTAEGLISSGSRDTQLTWMDATAWGRPVTPRYGYAVELNALWYDSLYLLRKLCIGAGVEVPENIESLLSEIPVVFREKFWIEEGGYLTDTVNENGKDYKLRPNMLFASSACEGLLNAAERKSVYNAAEKSLLTDFGLRTLSPDDPDFCPKYSGGPDARDSKYHQGTVWPWLLGIFIETAILTSEDIAKTKKFCSDYVSNLLEKHLYQNGWGFVSEVFDAIEPEDGKGTFAQAWSSGEIIRASEMIRRIGNT